MVCTCRSWHGEKPAWHVPINPQLTGGARKAKWEAFHPPFWNLTFFSDSQLLLHSWPPAYFFPHPFLSFNPSTSLSLSVFLFLSLALKNDGKVTFEKCICLLQAVAAACSACHSTLYKWPAHFNSHNCVGSLCHSALDAIEITISSVLP